MFQSIEYGKLYDYNKKTDCYSYKYDLTDSDFRCSVLVAGVDADVLAEDEGEELCVEAVIKEYGWRNLNVAYNLLLYFRWYEKQYGSSIAKQIEWVEEHQPLFTPELKEQIEKYMALL